MAKTVVIDSGECMGCGSCEEVCPEVFKINDATGLAEVINPAGSSEDEIQEAIDMCPAQCIAWK
ncbi:MAG: ferredoxin [Peptococcaceae bacterium]|nr:ferredoxin [Peptococcaceae bacterium]